MWTIYLTFEIPPSHGQCWFFRCRSSPVYDRCCGKRHGTWNRSPTIGPFQFQNYQLVAATLQDRSWDIECHLRAHHRPIPGILMNPMRNSDFISCSRESVLTTCRGWSRWWRRPPLSILWGLKRCRWAWRLPHTQLWSWKSRDQALGCRKFVLPEI